MHTRATSAQTDAWAQLAAYRASNIAAQTDATAAATTAAEAAPAATVIPATAVTGSVASPVSNDFFSALFSLNNAGSGTDGSGDTAPVSAQSAPPPGANGSGLLTLLSGLGSASTSPAGMPAGAAAPLLPQLPQPGPLPFSSTSSASPVDQQTAAAVAAYTAQSSSATSASLMDYAA